MKLNIIAPKMINWISQQFCKSFSSRKLSKIKISLLGVTKQNNQLKKEKTTMILWMTSSLRLALKKERRITKKWIASSCHTLDHWLKRVNLILQTRTVTIKRNLNPILAHQVKMMRRRKRRCQPRKQILAHQAQALVLVTDLIKELSN